MGCLEIACIEGVGYILDQILAIIGTNTFSYSEPNSLSSYNSSTTSLKALTNPAAILVILCSSSKLICFNDIYSMNILNSMKSLKSKGLNPDLSDLSHGKVVAVS